MIYDAVAGEGKIQIKENEMTLINIKIQRNIVISLQISPSVQAPGRLKMPMKYFYFIYPLR